MHREPRPPRHTDNHLESSRILSETDVSERFNRDRFVKDAPRFTDQLAGGGREHMITYVHSPKALLNHTADDEYVQSRAEISEMEALRELQMFLEVACKYLPEPRFAEVAQLMLDNLTFIGKQEFEEGAWGIASHWKSRLDEDPELQILAVSGEVAKTQPYYRGPRPLIKSDSYVLESILLNFSDEELTRYAGRLLVDVEDVTAEPSHVAAIQIDDWVRQGEHMITSFEAFTDRHPELEDSMEIQLITASEEVIGKGFTVLGSSDNSEMLLPVRAYYRAHDSRHELIACNSQVSGWHSTADFDFAETLEVIAQRLRSVGINLELPALANIVRLYRNFGSAQVELVQRSRVKRFAQAGNR